MVLAAIPFTEMKVLFATDVNSETIDKICKTVAMRIPSPEYQTKFTFLRQKIAQQISTSLYIAVPAILEAKLLRLLDITALSTSIKVSDATQMKLETDIRRKAFIGPDYAQNGPKLTSPISSGSPPGPKQDAVRGRSSVPTPKNIGQMGSLDVRF